MNVSDFWRPSGPTREQVQRSLNTAGAGSVLLQTEINKVVAQLTHRDLGALSILDRKPGSGNAAYVNRRSAGTTGGAWVADTDTATEETGSYAQSSFDYRTALTKGTITRKLIATGRSYGDVLAEEVAAKAEDFAALIESALFTGNSGAGGNANQINGLLTLIQLTSGQIVAQTSAALGGALTLAKLDEAIDLVKGKSNRSDLLIFTSRKMGRAINAALQAQQRFNDTVEVKGGFRVREYDGIPIIESTGLPDTLVWSGSTVTAFTGGTSSAIVIVNRRYWWMEELTPTTVMPLARSTSQNENFEIFWDGALVQHNRLGGVLLGGLSG
jgi:hypothetical protein